MMANAPLRSGISFLEGLKRADNGTSGLDSELASLSFSSTIAMEVTQKPDFSLSSLVSPLEGPVSLVQQESKYFPTPPLSPAFQQSNKPPLAQRHSFGDDSYGTGSRNSSSSPGGSSGSLQYKHSAPAVVLSSPVLSETLSFAASLPPPPNLDATLDGLNGNFSRSENCSSNSSGNRVFQPFGGTQYVQCCDTETESPYLSTPRKQGGATLMGGASLTDITLSSSGSHFRQAHYSAKSSPSSHTSSTILSEGQPPNMYGNDGIYHSPAGNCDRYSSRPPRHFGGSQGVRRGSSDNIVLKSPPTFGGGVVTNITSDGSFNFCSPTPSAEVGSGAPVVGPADSGHMSPLSNINGHSVSQGMIVGSTSFESLRRGPLAHQGIPYGREPFDPSMIHHHTHSALHQTPPGFVTNCFLHDYSNNAPPREQLSFDNTGTTRTVIIQNSSAPGLRRHHSTGSQHIVVNSLGEIIGHSSPVTGMHRGSFDGYHASEPGHHSQLYQRQQQLSVDGTNGYGGQNLSPFAQRHGYTQTQEGVSHRVHRLPSHDEVNASHNTVSTMDVKSEAIGVDYQVHHHRNHTQPTLPIFEQNQAMKSRCTSGQQPSFFDNNFEYGLASENNNVERESQIDSKPPSPVKLRENGQGFAFGPPQMLSRSLPSSSPIEQMSTNATGRSSRYLQTESPAHPLTAGASLAKSGPRMVYYVKFKRTQRNFVLGQRITRDIIKIGCYVKVEADRGEDLGIVLGVTPMEKFVAVNRSKPLSGTGESMSSIDGNCLLSSNQNANISDLKRIMRVATHDEISLLDVKREEEDELLKVCFAKVHQRSLPMTVVDAEYQFDRHKLTFFFEAEGRIDFRELVRDLFSIYKTRIWMQQLDKTTAGTDTDTNRSKTSADQVGDENNYSPTHQT